MKEMMARSICIRVHTRCSTAEQFVAMFRRFSTDTSMFVPMAEQRDAGTAVELSMHLADDTVVLAATGEIAHRYDTADNAFGKAGVEIAIRELAAGSQALFERMRAAPIEPVQDDDTVPVEIRPVAPEPPSDPFERVAMVALDRSSGRPATARLKALGGHVAKSVRGVRWWLLRRS